MNSLNVWIATQLEILIAHNIQKDSYLQDAMSNQVLLLVTPASSVSILYCIWAQSIEMEIRLKYYIWYRVENVSIQYGKLLNV